jgi:hypothetical protein
MGKIGESGEKRALFRFFAFSRFWFLVFAFSLFWFFCAKMASAARALLLEHPECAARALGRRSVDVRALDDAELAATQMVREAIGADDALDESPLWLSALRTLDERTVVEFVLAVVAVADAPREMRESIAERVALARDFAPPAYLLAAERLMHAMADHGEYALFERVFPNLDATRLVPVWLHAREYEGDTDLLRVFNASEALALVRALEYDDSETAMLAALVPFESPLVTTVESFWLPVLSAVCADAHRTLLVRMLRATNVEFLDDVAARRWVHVLAPNDVRANAARLAELGALDGANIEHATALLDATSYERVDEPGPRLRALISVAALEPETCVSASRSLARRAPAHVIAAALETSPRHALVWLLREALGVLDARHDRAALGAATIGVCALRVAVCPARRALERAASESMHACLGRMVHTRETLHEGLTALLRHKLCCACAPARCACAAPVTAVTAMARAANPLALRAVVDAMVRHGMWQRMRHLLAVALETTREAERALDGVAESRVEAFANELSRGLCVGLRG